MSIHVKVNGSKSRKSISQKKSSLLCQKVLGNISKTLGQKAVNNIAKETKFIKRSSSKITGFKFLTTMLISNIDAEHAALEKISDHFCSLYQIRIRAQSIMERLNDESSANFFKNIFENLLKNQFDSFTKDLLPELLSPFSKILIQDSSVCDLNQKLASAFKGSGGRASKSSLKLDVIYDFKAKRFEHLTLTDRKDADQKLGDKIFEFVAKNSLIIRDLGYLKMESLLKITQAEGFFLSRIKKDTHVYLNKEDEKCVDLAKYLHMKFRKSNKVDTKVYITSAKVCVRIIVYRVPKEISAQRRRLAHLKAKKEGRTASEKNLTILDFSIFITNVPEEIWPAEIVGTIYRIRWQIELMFKDWKSKLKFDCLYGVNKYRIKSLVYLRAILVLIINEVYKLLDYIGYCKNRVVSLHKVYSWIRCPNRLKRIISGEFSWWEKRKISDIITTCMLHQTRERKTSLQSIHEKDFYYMEAG